jgi:hypothetical protein
MGCGPRPAAHSRSLDRSIALDGVNLDLFQLTTLRRSTGEPTWKTFQCQQWWLSVDKQFDDNNPSGLEWRSDSSAIMLSRLAASLQPLTRSVTTATLSLPSTAYTEAAKSGLPAVQSTPDDLTLSERRALECALRVDQAGEIAANYIYQGQMAVLGRDRQVRNLIQVCFGNVS